MKLIDNMTVRVSWALVLAVFAVLVCGVSVLVLYSVGFAEQTLAGVENALHAQQTFAGFASTVRWAVGLVLLLLVATIVGVFWGVSANVIRPLQQVVEHCERIAAGDLSGHIEVHSSNEIGNLFAALGHIQRQMAKTVGAVRLGSRQIQAVAQEVADGNSSLSTRTVQQSASLEDTASSMEELTSTVGQNADNARQASSLADTAAQAAKHGGEVVEEVVSTMAEISGSSHKVAEIIKLIDTIAFQTNILALNASVEAARAGEQGRGFAVVAGEVRNLASRSADAAKEIRTLIGESLQRVGAGSELVAQAGSVMREIVDSVQKVADIMDEIAAASQEQSNGIGLVNQAVTQMEQATQQNANLVQDASRAATDLIGEAQHLLESVQGFRIDGALERATDKSWAQAQYESAQRRVAEKAAASRGVQDGSNTDDWQTF